MQSLKALFGSKDSDILVVGSETVVPQSFFSTFHLSSFFHVFSMLVLFGSLLFSYYYTADLISIWEKVYKEAFEMKISLATEQRNLQHLQELSENIDEISEQLVLIDQSIPTDPRYDEVIADIEDMAMKSGLEPPESISWQLVPSGEISNEDLSDLTVYSYSFSFKSSYKALLEFLAIVRSHLRLMDVRALTGLNMNSNDGIVSGNVVIWVYSIPSFD